MSGGRLLTKSLFKTAVTCPRKLVYATRPDVYPRRDASNPLMRNLVEEGRRVEAYCRLQFPGGIVVGGGGGRPLFSGSKSISTSDSQECTSSEDSLVKETRSLINQPPGDCVTIFEGAVRHDDFYIRADILDRTGTDELRLIEIKAKSWDSSKADNPMVGKRGGIKSKFLPYLQDVAFQKMVLREAFPDLRVTAFLMMPDKAAKTDLINLNALVGMIQSTEEASNNDSSPPSYLDMDASEARTLIMESDEKLTAIVDVSDLTDAVLANTLDYPGSSGESFVEAATRWAHDFLQENGELGSIAPTPIGSHCRSCEFRLKNDSSVTGRSGFNVCWREATNIDKKVLQDGSSLVVDLWNGSKKDVNQFISEEKYLLSDLSPSDLGLTEDGQDLKKKKKDGKINAGMSRSLRQFHQIVGLQSKSESENPAYLLDRDYLTKEMDGWHFPFHFIDFETSTPALPYSAGKAPFDTIAFQFSHHLLHENGRIEHANQFLHTTPGECPNGAFVRALGASVGNQDGTVFRWGVHENTVLSSLLQVEPSEKLAPLLSGGSRRMIDLMQSATKGYYSVGSGASSSIKRLLLPTLCASARLEQIYGTPTYSSHNFADMQWYQRDENGEVRDPYDLLAASDIESESGAVVDGGAAIAAYQILQSGNVGPDARARLEASLLRYCELDTLAMAMIVQAWQGFLQE